MRSVRRWEIYRNAATARLIFDDLYSLEFFLILIGYFTVQRSIRSKEENTTRQNVLLWTAQKFCGITLHVSFAVILHSPLLIYGYFFRTVGHLDQWSSWTGLFHASLIRVWSGLCIGWAVFQLFKWISTINFTPPDKASLSLLELSTIGIVFISMYTRIHCRLDFLRVGLLGKME